MAYENRLGLSGSDLQNWIGRHYGLGVTVGKIRPGYMSTVVWVETQTEQFVFKIYGETDFAQIVYGLKVSDHLKKKGLPVSACVASQEGNFFVDFFGYKAALWSCLSGDTFTLSDQAELGAAGKMLGKFHHVAESLSRDDSNKLTVERLVKELEATWDLVTDDEGRRLVEQFGECLDEILSGVDTGLPETVLHCDYRAQNLLFGCDDVAGVLDLDSCCVGPRIFDVVYALAFFQAVIADRPLFESEMLTFLKAYHCENELTDAELDCLGACLGLALLKGMTLWLHIAYVERVYAKAKAWIDVYNDFFLQHKQIAKRLVDALGVDG